MGQLWIRRGVIGAGGHGEGLAWVKKGEGWGKKLVWWGEVGEDRRGGLRA